MARMNGGQIIVDYLVQENVAHAFGLCGHGNISFIDALYERSAKLLRIPCATSRWRDSWRTSTTGLPAGRLRRLLLRPWLRQYSRMSCERLLRPVPYLAITGNVPTNQFNRGAFQETYRHYQADFPSVVRPFCKRVFQPTRFMPFMRQAGKLWSPVAPDLSCSMYRSIFSRKKDVEMPQAKDWNANISCRCGADPEGVRKAVDMLLDAKRLVIMVGQGVKYAAATVELVRWRNGCRFGGLFIERHGRSTQIIPSRSASSLAMEPIRRTMPHGKPMSCSL